MAILNGYSLNDLTEPLLPKKDKFYEEFMKRFNQEWTNKDSAFSFPASRAFACSTMIELLLKQERSKEAFELILSAIKRGAWNPKIGFSFDKTTAKRCEECFNKTKKFLHAYGYNICAEG